MKEKLQTFKEYIELLKCKILDNKYDLLNIVLFSGIVVLLSCLTANHSVFFVDKGREFLIPQEILNGQVPYKDILLIYFPLAYYINAFIYKLLGVSINSLIISQTLLCTIFVAFFYFCARLFLERKCSFWLTLLIIVSCIFQHTNDLFNYIMPYSYARTYGVMSFFCCMFCFLKLFKTDKIQYLYLASFIAGFCASCKLEFMSVYLLLIIGLFLYKKLKISEYIKVFCLSSVVPILVVITLFLQGVTIDNLIPIIKFCSIFAQTDVMKNFLTHSGMYPQHYIYILDYILKNTSLLILIVAFCFFALIVKTRLRALYVFFIAILIWHFYYDSYKLCCIWAFLPYYVLYFTVVRFKELQKNDKPFLLLLIASILISQREFFLLQLTCYGTYSFVFLALSLSAIIFYYITKFNYKLPIKKLFLFVCIILIGLYSYSIIDKCLATNFKVQTRKGTISLNYQQYIAIQSMFYYIYKYVNVHESVLVLPEGNMVNFLAERHVGMYCFMMDRLYHDAYGEKQAMNMVKKADNDYIILVQGFGIYPFESPFLYESGANLLSEYIENNYNIEKEYNCEVGSFTILKRKDKI